MTVTSPIARNTYAGSGTTGPFAYNFKIFDASQMKVTTTDPSGNQTVLVLDTDYTVSGVGASIGGSVTLTVALALNWTLTLQRNVLLEQLTDVRDQGRFFPSTFEDALDYQMMALQQIADLLSGPQQFAVYDEFEAGIGFVAGTTTTLTLSQLPGNPAAVTVTFDSGAGGIVQHHTKYTVIGKVITFGSAIPIGVVEVQAQYLGATSGSASSNVIDASAVTYTPAGTGTVQRMVQARLEDMLWLEDFGVVGDGVTDDTVNVQKALTAGAAQQKVIYGGSLVCKISSALTMSGPGLVFDVVDYNLTTPPGFLAVGSGYTALTVTGRPQFFSCLVYGTGNAVGGIYLNNPQLARFQIIGAYNLNGFGVKVDKMWDSVVESIDIMQCGNATDYALSFNNAGDICNESVFGHIQVEKANTQAIYIDQQTQNCWFSHIHSEQATGNAAYTTWSLGGNRNAYGRIRLSANGSPTHTTCHMVLNNSSVLGYLTEGDIDTSVEVGSGSTATFSAVEVQGTFHPEGSQYGTVIVLGGHINALSDPSITGLGMWLGGNGTGRLLCYGCDITSLYVGFQYNGTIGKPEWCVLVDCNIGAIVATGQTSAAARFVRCRITTPGNLCSVAAWVGGVILEECDVGTTPGATTVSHVAGYIYLYGGTFNPNMSIANGATLRLARRAQLTGVFTESPAGWSDTLHDGTCIFTNDVGWGITQPPTHGTHYHGERTYKPFPAVGSPYYWVCTVAGSPGTFVAGPNL